MQIPERRDIVEALPAGPHGIRLKNAFANVRSLKEGKQIAVRRIVFLQFLKDIVEAACRTATDCVMSPRSEVICWISSASCSDVTVSA